MRPWLSPPLNLRDGAGWEWRRHVRFAFPFPLFFSADTCLFLLFRFFIFYFLRTTTPASTTTTTTCCL